MNNEGIAAILFDIADLLEIKDESLFRVRSYRRAGESLVEYPRDLVAMVEEELEGLELDGKEGKERARAAAKAIEAVPGIGKSIHGKLDEIVETGTCRLREELLREFGGEGILEVLRVPGIGPKKAGLFFSEIGVNSVDSLFEAAIEGRIEPLPRCGKKTEEKIIASIESMRRVSGRFRLPQAIKAAEDYTAYLKGGGLVGAISSCGSLRRWRSTIGDIDILVTPKERAKGREKAGEKEGGADPSKSLSNKIMTHFTSYGEVDAVVARGDTKSTVTLKSGINVDLRLVDDTHFGAALLYFTGSKSHNVLLRERAKKMGLRLNEYGLYKEADLEGGAEVESAKALPLSGPFAARPLASRTEEDIYRALGLTFIPPEYREGLGEVEMAERGSLSVPIEVSDIRGDLHMHTVESDGAGTLEEMAEVAMAMGYTYMAVTDHSQAVGIAGGLTEEGLLSSMARVDEYNRELKERGVDFTVLKGCEVDIMRDGTLDYSDEVLEGLDCVVGAVHSAFNIGKNAMTVRLLKAIRSGKINILAHPTGRLLGSREGYDFDAELLMDEAASFGVAMELNSHPRRLDLKAAHLRLAASKGVKVAVSTDSHSPGQLENIAYGVHSARRGLLRKEDILNTMELPELMAFLNK